MYIKETFIKLKNFLKPPPNLVVEQSLNLINMAEIAGQNREHTKTPALVMDGRCLLMPAFRKDGVGIQAMVRICVMLLARQAGATYVHLPFLKLAHQNIDSTDCSLTSEEWAAKWEAFFNLGKDEVHITDMANAIGKKTLTKHMSDRDRRFMDPKDVHQDMLPTLVDKIRDSNGGASGLYTFGLGLCRRPRECGLFLDTEFIQILQEKFEANGYKPEEVLYNEKYLNVAIHIRRGDVWDACQNGSTEECHTNKMVSEEYYVELIERLRKCFEPSSKPVQFHIFSDGQPDNFRDFTFTGEREASLKLDSGVVIENIRFHLRQSSFDTLYHMIKAPIFIPGKSTFSVVAVILNKFHVLYENEIREFYQYDLLEKYMDGNPKIISLADLEDRINDVLEIPSYVY